jgi:hypothetical protein
LVETSLDDGSYEQVSAKWSFQTACISRFLVVRALTSRPLMYSLTTMREGYNYKVPRRVVCSVLTWSLCDVQTFSSTPCFQILDSSFRAKHTLGISKREVFPTSKKAQPITIRRWTS